MRLLRCQSYHLFRCSLLLYTGFLSILGLFHLIFGLQIHTDISLTQDIISQELWFQFSCPLPSLRDSNLPPFKFLVLHLSSLYLEIPITLLYLSISTFPLLYSIIITPFYYYKSIKSLRKQEDRSKYTEKYVKSLKYYSIIQLTTYAPLILLCSQLNKPKNYFQEKK